MLNGNELGTYYNPGISEDSGVVRTHLISVEYKSNPHRAE